MHAAVVRALFTFTASVRIYLECILPLRTVVSCESEGWTIKSLCVCVCVCVRVAAFTPACY